MGPPSLDAAATPSLRHCTCGHLAQGCYLTVVERHQAAVGFRVSGKLISGQIVKSKIVHSVWQQCMLDSHNYYKIQTYELDKKYTET